ncbi:Taurine dioxygenase [Frankia canadensis]|uniref:Taurine dioxygenase n=1 Tax=Frankia canadensis TaxID=1836972 RepID=A0A2I2L1G3_9ACTN|nr:TauD/TfdA family dioxygenase [Frankia canadensis]SNQ51748.1 Taurine dioxygenase [Frankia canadensis]SOU59038.1 Taurine dioxygenase [Frankia canadensis]
MTTLATQVQVRPLTSGFGAEVTGVDLSRPLDADILATIRRAWLDRQVLFFPGQNIDADAQTAFARALGEVTAPSAYLPPIDDRHREVVAFDSRENKEEYVRRGRHHGWHVDISFQSTPPAGSVFNVVTLPPVGGATWFASAQLAYETLSAPIQRLLDGLVAVHSFRSSTDRVPLLEGRVQVWEDEQANTAAGGAEHPVVTVHPETGRRGLFVNPGFTRSIKGLSAHESSVLLELVYDHALQPEHLIQYRWNKGDVALWDNRTVWHRRGDDFDPDAVRIVHRVQLRGTRPVGVA